MGTPMLELAKQIHKRRNRSLRSIHIELGYGGIVVVEMDIGRGIHVEKAMGEKI